MKGKKFSAAEKHFREKEIKYQEQILSKHVLIAELDNENGELKRQNEKLLKEIEYLKALYGLSEEEKMEYIRNMRSYANFSEVVKMLEKNIPNYI